MKKMLIINFIITLCISIANRFPNTIINIQETKLEEEINQTLNNMTLDEKIGQMFIISYRSSQMDDKLQTQLNYKPGGFILFKENFTTYENTLKFIEQIENTASIPLFIAIDQEGGRVQRLTQTEDMQATVVPSMMEVGATNNEKLGYEIGKVLAEELRVFGINMDFAPSLDILQSEENKVIGNRSFGTNPAIVSKMGLSVAKGLEENGVIAVYKHFPGHGSTIDDSHYLLPVITKTKEELFSFDIIPFQQAIVSKAEVIMIGHLAVPNIIGDQTPASLSKILVTDLLKKEMGYQGLVVTDALNMGALTQHYSEKEIYEKAIQAGIDLLLMPIDFHQAIEYVKQSIQEGKINEEQINNSVRKILNLKKRKLLGSKNSQDFLGSETHKQVIEKMKSSQR